MTNYRDKFLGNKTVKISTKDLDRKDGAFLKEELAKVSDSKMLQIEREVESSNFIFNFNKLSKIIRPNISHKDPSTFAFYGSAELYYKDAFENITNNYPYDGSRNERISWSISASALDLLILQHAYPKTTGNIIFSPGSYGTITSTPGSHANNYALANNNKEYISFSGGPRVKSNYVESSRLGNNLGIDPVFGNTVEFWLKKGGWGHATRKETILDVYTPSAASGSANYGRFLVELNPGNSTQPVEFSYISASTGFINQGIGETNALTKTSLSDNTWRHIALSVANHSGSLRARLYIDGTLNQTITKAITVGEIESNTSATLGALATTNHGLGGLGWGKLSGSIDDFRFWRTERNSKHIGTFYDKPVYGGTAKDNSNPELGVYYKFNEGITGTGSIDANILDFSGRINNGTFVGYTSENRGEDSAITLSSATTTTEESDPIVLPSHIKLVSKKKDYMLIGTGHDRQNHSALVKSLPQWVYDEDVFGANKADSEMGILIQAISSEFDTIKALIDNVLNINSKDTQDFFTATSDIQYENKYLLGCSDDFSVDDSGRRDNSRLADFSLSKEAFFVETHPIINQTDYYEYFYSMSESKKFSQDTLEIRDKILKNVHKNLVHIYKTKGTEESFRNMIRCFGVGDDLIRLNVYGNNEEREIKNEAIYTSAPKKSISFEGKNNEVTIYQSTDGTAVSSMPSSSLYTPWTVEGSFLFPDNKNQDTTHSEVSLFGAKSISSNNFSFNVSAKKFAKKQSQFKLSSDDGLFNTLTSAYFPEVYDGAKWHLAVRVARDSAMTLSSSANAVPPYKIEFLGHHYDLDVLRNSFHLSSSITEAQFQKWSAGNKTFYAGAQRADITGSVTKKADARALSLSVWSDALLDSELAEHAMNPHTYGRSSPQAISPHDPGKNILTRDTEILNWRFEDTAEPDSNSKIIVTDFSSGSVDKISAHGVLAGSSYPATSTAFADTKNAIIQEHFPVVEYVEVDNAYTSDRVKIKDGEYEKFSIDSRPLTYTFSFEKSMYQIISKEMLNFVAGISSFNNILGEPVNKYRQDYKALQKLNDRFFSKVDSGVDLDKFVEYYKWIDSSLGQFLTSIQPANSRMTTDLKNVVESHALERNKYQHPFPTVEFKNPNIPTAPLLGINELLYDWEHGHAPQAGEVYGSRRTIFTFNVSTLSTSDIAVDENLDIGDGTQTVRFTFKAASGTTPFDAAGALEIGTGNSRAIALVTAELASKITASALTIKASSNGNQVILIHDHPAGLISVSEDHEGSDCILGSSQGLFTHVDNQVDETILNDHNCLWQKDRKEHTEDRNNVRDRIITQVSGSTYVLRKLTKPYKYSVDRQEFLSHGSNRKTNKIKDFYKIINSGHEVSLGTDDIYEFRQCDDIIDPQRERIYTTKANTEGTGGYLDADGDLLFPFTLYSSSAGVDFSVFKKQLSINNNHDDVESSWAQSPFTFAHHGGMPHRRVPFGTADKDRPEAYELSASATKLTLKQPSLYQRPKSMFYRDSSAGRLMSVANIKHTTGSLLLGNYTKDYEVVMTNGRRENNNYFVDNEGSFLKIPQFAPSNYVLGDADFAVPNRGRTEHVIVNRFSAPGGPESMGPAGLDRLSEEYSINDTVNYRNSMVRGVWNILSGEYSSLHGYRTGSTVQASVHMTNRNPMRTTGSLGKEVDYDNFFVQHPIPQNDFGYSWITASAEYDVYNFLNKNSNLGHQHMLNLPGTTMESSETIPFLTSSEVGTYITAGSEAGTRVFGIMSKGLLSDEVSFTPADFVGINSNIYEPISSSVNILGYPSFDVVNKAGNNDWFEANYLNQNYVNKGEELIGSTTTTAHPSKYAGQSAILNSIILHRQGPYGWPSWKQIRGGNHPIMREHRKNNTYSILMKGQSYSDLAESEYRHTWFPEEEETMDATIKTEARVVKNYIDIPTTSRFTPIVMTKHKLVETTDTGHSERRSLIQEPLYGAQFRERSLWYSDQYYYELGTQGSEGALTQREATAFDSDIYQGTISMRMTLPNDVTTYSNRQIIKDFDLDEMRSPKKQNFMKVLSTWFPSYANAPGASVVPELREVNYIETLYPKEMNTYAKNSRTRQDFIFHGWNSTRANRQVFLSGNVGYTGTGTYTKQPNLVAFPQISLTNAKDYLKSSMGRVDMVNIASTASLSFGAHITASTWPLDARKDFTALPVSIDLSFNTGKEIFLANNSMGTKGEGLFQNDYGIFAMGHNAIHGTPPISMTYNRRIPQEIKLLSDDFESGTLGQNPTGWTPNGTLSDYNVRALANSEGNRILAFVGATTANQRHAQLGTTLTGSAIVRFSLMAGGGQLDTDYGFAATLGTTSQRAPNAGETFDVQYKITGESTWKTVAQIPYEASMQTTFKYCESIVPLGPTTTWNLRFYQSGVAGGYHDKWGIDDLEIVRTVLAGEAKFQAADKQLGPFYDSYEEYRDEIRRVGQDHSIVPEFRISDFVEEYYDASNPSDTSRMRNEFLSLTGAIYHSSSGDLQVGSQFFKTYGNSEFMKYFGSLEESLGSEQEKFSPTRLTLRCQAAMKFLPYKGFFPAERVQQIGEIFTRTYMPSGSYNTRIISFNAPDLTDVQKMHLLDRRLEASKQQVMKPLFGPGVLNNSIKSGLAVDYPLFDTNFDTTRSDFESVSGSVFLTGSVPRTAATAQIQLYTMYNLVDGDTVTITSTAGVSKTYTAKSSENLGSGHFKLAGNECLASLRDCILHSSGQGHNGEVKVTGPTTFSVFGVLTSATLSLEQNTPGSPGNIEITSNITTQGVLKPLWHSGFSNGAGGTVITGLTGSLVNSSPDSGIPRLTGSVVRRIGFDDMLYAEDLYGESIPDNEPHPSASLFYGNSLWNKVIERSPVFGKLDKTLTREQIGVEFDTNRSTFGAALSPFKSAIHNFASETVSFFMKDQQLETIMTPPVKLEIEDENQIGQEYKMRVYLQNANTTMYDRHSAFGPPVDDGENNMVFYERGAPVSATAPITIAASPAALGASKSGTGQSAPTASDLEANPSITMVPIDAEGTAGTSTKVFFYDPRNYSTDRTIAAIAGSVTLDYVSDPSTTVASRFNGPAEQPSAKPNESLGTGGKISFTAYDSSDNALKVTYFDPTDHLRYIRHSLGDGTAATAEVKRKMDMQFRAASDFEMTIDSTYTTTGRFESNSNSGSPALTTANINTKLPGFDLIWETGGTKYAVARIRYYEGIGRLYYNKNQSHVTANWVNFNDDSWTYDPFNLKSTESSVYPGIYNISGNGSTDAGYGALVPATMEKGFSVDEYGKVTWGSGLGTGYNAKRHKTYFLDINGMSDTQICQWTVAQLNAEKAQNRTDNGLQGFTFTRDGDKLFIEYGDATVDVEPDRDKESTVGATFYGASDSVTEGSNVTDFDFSAYQAAQSAVYPHTAMRIQWAGTTAITGSAINVTAEANVTTPGWHASNIGSEALSKDDTADSDAATIVNMGTTGSVFVSVREVRKEIDFQSITSDTNFSNGTAVLGNVRALGAVKAKRAGGNTVIALGGGLFGSYGYVSGSSISTYNENGSAATSTEGGRRLPGGNLTTFTGSTYIQNAHHPGVNSRNWSGIRVQEFDGVDITGSAIVTFDFCHPWSSSGSASTYGYAASTGPSTFYGYTGLTYPNEYTGLPAGRKNQHLFAQYKRHGANYWHTVMEIAPGAEEFATWTTAGFAINDGLSTSGFDAPGDSDSGTNKYAVRIIACSAENDQDDAIWLIDNIKIYDEQNLRSKTDLVEETQNAINASHVTVGVTANGMSGYNDLKLTQDTAGAAGNGNMLSSFFFSNGGTSYTGMVTNDLNASNTEWGFRNGADATYVRTYFDVTGSQPGHSSTIRYCAIRQSGSAPYGLWNTETLRNQLKHEIDQLISGNGLQFSTSTESTNKVILTQLYGGEKGNNNPGPGSLVVADGTGGTNVATKVLASTADSVFTGGGQSTDVQPVSKSVPDMHGFMPYVPPYLDRNASPYVEYTFIPRENKTYNAIEIVDQLTASYVNFHKTPENYRTNTNYKESMSITASINLKEIISMERDRYIVDTGPDGQEIVEQNPDFAKYGYRWVMQPKWETPVHDFTEASPDALRVDTNAVTAAPNSPWKPRVWSKYYDEFEPTSTIPYLTGSTGMWHQLGSNVKNSFKGYYLRVEDVGANGLASAVGFLDVDPAATVKAGSPNTVGLMEEVQKSKKSLTVKLGKLASKKNVKEAVVAIPYYLDNACNVSFFDLDPDQYLAAKLKVEKLKDDAIAAAGRAKTAEEVQNHIKTYEDIASIAGTTAESSIAYQLRMMERYVLPPVFDFELVADEDVMNPFVMYFFEFNAELNEKDLSNIWQNLYPESAGSTASPRYSHLNARDPSRDDVVYSSHILDSSIVHKLQGSEEEEENLSNYKEPGKIIENETRWLVFKCKYRAEGDYSFIKDKSIEPTIFFERKAETIGRRPSLRRRNRQGAVNLPMAYNWPYDYFSFVELIKLESKVDFYAIGKTPKPRNPRRGS